MHIHKRFALAGALIASAFAAGASPAHAAIDGAQGGATFVAGPTRLNAALDISCSTTTVTVAPGVLAPSQSVPVTFPVSLAFAGCSTSLGGATAHCRGVTLTALTASGGALASRLTLPAYAPTPPSGGAGCVIDTSTGCQYRFSNGTANVNLLGVDGGPGNPAVLTIGRTGFAFTASGGFACFGINSGTAFYESSPSNGDIHFVEGPGSDVTFA